MSKRKKKDRQTRYWDKLALLTSHIHPSLTPVHFIAICMLLFLSMMAFGVVIGLSHSTRSIAVEYPLLSSPYSQPTLQVEPTLPPKPYKSDYSSPQPYMTARAALAVDVISEEVLYSYNEDVQLWPASTTKLMTAMVAIDHFKLDDAVTIIDPVVEGSVMGLIPGEKITMENLLEGLLIQSANDAAFAIADAYEGGREAFVSEMNKKAKELDLANTHYENPAGFDSEQQFTTASDLATVSLASLSYPTIKKIVATPSVTVSSNDYTYFHKLTNVNQLLGVVPGVAGIKTGWTENAKENLVNLTYRNGNGVMTVILGSDDRFGETMALTNWVFDNYIWNE